LNPASLPRIWWGDQQRALVPADLSYLSRDLPACHSGHRDIEQHDVRVEVAHCGHDISAVVHPVRFVTFLAQELRQRKDDVALIVRYQHAEGAPRALTGRRRGQRQNNEAARAWCCVVCFKVCCVVCPGL